MSRLADYGKFDNLDVGSDEDMSPQRTDAPPPPGTEPGPARYYKRVQVGCVLVRDYGAGAGTPADRLLALTLLRRYGPRIKGKRVVELGAQAGAAGLTAAKMGAAWVSLVSDDPRAAYALRVESVKNGVSRTVKNVCTDWLEDDLNRDVAVEVVLEPVGADVLHGARHAVLDALHPQRVGRPRVVRDERHPRGAHLRRGEARRAGLRAELDDALALDARAVAPQQRQREEPVGGRARAGAVVPHQHAADLHALVVPGRAGLGAWWRRRVGALRTHVLVAAHVQIVEFTVVREARHCVLSCSVRRLNLDEQSSESCWKTAG